MLNLIFWNLDIEFTKKMWHLDEESTHGNNNYDHGSIL